MTDGPKMRRMRDPNGFETGLDQQRIELTSNQCIAACMPLQVNEALNCGVGCRTVRIEVGRSVITLDHGDCASSAEQVLENRQRLQRPREMFEDKADY
jgi:hypothetical protein